MICVDVMEAFKELDCQVRKVRFDHKSDFFDADFQKYIEACLTEEEYDFLFSINYIPVLALAAFNKKIRYVSWVYDCPCGTMYSETIKSPYNIVFDFDEAEKEYDKHTNEINNYKYSNFNFIPKYYLFNFFQKFI